MDILKHAIVVKKSLWQIYCDEKRANVSSQSYGNPLYTYYTIEQQLQKNAENPYDVCQRMPYQPTYVHVKYITPTVQCSKMHINTSGLNVSMKFPHPALRINLLQSFLRAKVCIYESLTWKGSNIVRHWNETQF